MFHLWHLTAILGVFVIGFFAGRLSMRIYMNVKIEELENRVEAERLAKEKEGMEWAARRH
jgi:predicted transcriptional regulator